MLVMSSAQKTSSSLHFQAASSAATIPAREKIFSWLTPFLTTCEQAYDITVRVVDIDEMTQLNAAYRGKSGPTNVLSFNYDVPCEIDDRLIGDIIICPHVLEKEALDQAIPLEFHWAHIVIHGLLHLFGYDHEQDDEAEMMEQKERSLLHMLGFDDRYFDIS